MQRDLRFQRDYPQDPKSILIRMQKASRIQRVYYLQCKELLKLNFVSLEGSFILPIQKVDLVPKSHLTILCFLKILQRHYAFKKVIVPVDSFCFLSWRELSLVAASAVLALASAAELSFSMLSQTSSSVFSECSDTFSSLTVAEVPTCFLESDSPSLLSSPPRPP